MFSTGICTIGAHGAFFYALVEVSFDVYKMRGYVNSWRLSVCFICGILQYRLNGESKKCTNMHVFGCLMNLVCFL